jgi:hypothetical protein
MVQILVLLQKYKKEIITKVMLAYKMAQKTKEKG